MKLYIRAHDLGVRNAQPILSALREYGLDGVQLVAYKAFDDIPYEPGAMTAGKADMIGAALREAGMEIALVGAYFNPVHSDPGKVDRCKAIFRDYLDCADRLGCPVVGSETGSFNDDKWTFNPLNRTPEALGRVADAFRELCDYAALSNARVAIEGAAGHVCYDPAALERAMWLIGRDNLDVIFDLYNYLDDSNYAIYRQLLAEGLSRFSGRIRCWHIKDCVFRNGRPQQVPVGQGELDFRFILSAIKDADPDARLVLEGTTGGDVPGSASFIRNEWEKI